MKQSTEILTRAKHVSTAHKGNMKKLLVAKASKVTQKLAKDQQQCIEAKAAEVRKKAEKAADERRKAEALAAAASEDTADGSTIPSG